MLWVLKQWMPQVMCMRNSGHLLKTEGPENLVWQLTEPVMEKIFSYIWQSISVSHIRKSSYPDSSNGRYEVVGVYISTSGKGKETVLESLGNDKTMERASLKLWKVCTQVLLQSTPQPPSKQNTVKPPKGTQWEKKRCMQCLQTWSQGMRSSQTRGLCSPWLASVGWNLVRKHSPKHMEPIKPNCAWRLARLQAPQTMVTALILGETWREGELIGSLQTTPAEQQGHSKSSHGHRTAAPQQLL